jgi:hypothetical protein
MTLRCVMWSVMWIVGLTLALHTRILRFGELHGSFADRNVRF